MPKSMLEANAEAPRTLTDLEELDLARQRLVDNVSTLIQISGATSMTNAQVLNAIKFLARNQLNIMRFLSRQFSDE